MITVSYNSTLLAFTLGCFTLTLLACIVGLFYVHYHDNWLQHLGLIGVGLGSALKLEQISTRGFVSLETALLAGSVALFAAGVVWKVIQHRRADLRPPKPRPPNSRLRAGPPRKTAPR